VGAWAIQNRGTLGGNVCNASPAGDTLPLLLAAEARFVLGGPRGQRTVPADQFFVGYRKTGLGADELLERIDISITPEARLVYRKVGTRKAQSISRTLVAVRAMRSGGGLRDVRIGAGCVAPVAPRSSGTSSPSTTCAPPPCTAAASPATCSCGCSAT
jgi:CO/xanthine dehydrogenase FAD-binding subunit